MSVIQSPNLAMKDWIDHGLFVCHRCDNPPCVREDHLYYGTHLENMRDLKIRGGRRSGFFSVTEEMVAGASLIQDEVFGRGGNRLDAMKAALEYGLRKAFNDDVKKSCLEEIKKLQQENEYLRGEIRGVS